MRHEIVRHLENKTGPAGDHELRRLIAGAIPEDIGLNPIKGFGIDLSANRGFRKVFFSAKCQCGTAAVLSVEVAEDKTMDQVEEVLPALVERLTGQAQTFYSMSCESHERMRLGPALQR